MLTLLSVSELSLGVSLIINVAKATLNSSPYIGVGSGCCIIDIPKDFCCRPFQTQGKVFYFLGVWVPVIDTGAAFEMLLKVLPVSSTFIRAHCLRVLDNNNRWCTGTITGCYGNRLYSSISSCLLYTSDAADE